MPLRVVACAVVALTVALCTAAGAVAAPLDKRAVPDSPAEFTSGPATRATAQAAGAWGWSASARAWTQSSGTLAAALVRRGPTAAITRGQFVAALVRVEAIRAENYGAPRTLAESTTGAKLRDAAPSSVGARAIALGWLLPVKGSFAARTPITSNDAALAMTGVLGLRGSTTELAGRLKTEVPGAGGVYLYGAAQALVRTVGLRYNVLDPYDALELGPTEGVNVGHGAYMLQKAATSLDSWRINDAQRLASTFDLPDLGANQLTVLRTGVRQLGQPYVWAGETEGRQSEGHGGFDCSGFTIRIVNQSGVASDQLAVIGERTTYTQSAIPQTRRVTRAKLQPGDAIFFGDRGPLSTPTQNYHAGVYMGNGWFIHSSGGNGGVAINQLEGYWGEHFAWGRRALKVA